MTKHDPPYYEWVAEILDSDRKVVARRTGLLIEAISGCVRIKVPGPGIYKCTLVVLALPQNGKLMSDFEVPVIEEAVNYYAEFKPLLRLVRG